MELLGGCLFFFSLMVHNENLLHDCVCLRKLPIFGICNINALDAPLTLNDVCAFVVCVYPKNGKSLVT